MRAADRQLRAEVVARRDLADLGVAEIGVMFGAARDVELQGLDRRQREIDITRIILAAVGAGGGWAKAREGLRAFLVLATADRPAPIP